jgi:hypothetical protein
MHSSGLHRYWIKLAAPEPIGFKLGCGVTAFTEDDAKKLVFSQFSDAPPVIASMESDVDVSTLDPKHVIPNIGDCTRRGIWFPALGAL